MSTLKEHATYTATKVRPAIETWHDTMQRVNWQTNSGLTKQLLKGFITYYFTQFSRQWVQEAVLEALQENGFTVTLTDRKTRLGQSNVGPGHEGQRVP